MAILWCNTANESSFWIMARGTPPVQTLQRLNPPEEMLDSPVQQIGIGAKARRDLPESAPRRRSINCFPLTKNNGNHLTLLDIVWCWCSLALHKPSSASYLGNIV
jgi:hypothetical protein